MHSSPQSHTVHDWPMSDVGADPDLFYLSAPSPSLNKLIHIKRARLDDEYPSEILPCSHTVPRLRNEADTIHFLRQHTTIPVPTIVCAFSDRDTYYVQMEKMEGVVSADMIPVSGMAKVDEQIKGYLGELEKLRSSRFGGVGGLVCLPRWLTGKDTRPWSALRFPRRIEDEFVMCHGNLTGKDILVDPETYEVKCITGWECAGFYPPELERRRYARDEAGTEGRDGIDLDVEQLRRTIKGLAMKSSVEAGEEIRKVPLEAVRRRRQLKLNRRMPDIPRNLATINSPSHPFSRIDALILHAHRCLSALTRDTPTPEPIFTKTEGSSRITAATLTAPSSGVDYAALGSLQDRARRDQAFEQLGDALWGLTMESRKSFPGMSDNQDEYFSQLLQKPTKHSKSKRKSSSKAQSSNDPVSPINREDSKQSGDTVQPSITATGGYNADEPDLEETGEFAFASGGDKGPASGQLVRGVAHGEILEFKGFGGEGLVKKRPSVLY